MSYDEYEEELEKIKSENKIILNKFHQWQINSGLTEKTILKHMGNVDFYVNHYLVYEECIRPSDGISMINGFFDWFFPRKAMWSSPSTTKETVSSIKKFYKYLVEIELIEQADYKLMLSEIKECMPDWLEHYSREVSW